MIAGIRSSQKPPNIVKGYKCFKDTMGTFEIPYEKQITGLVRIERRSNIKPTHPSTSNFCKLCPSDLQVLGFNYIQKGLVYQIPEVFMNSQFEGMVDLLIRSLEKALVHFYPLAGSLSVATDGSMYIDCNDKGVEFIEASTTNNTSVTEILKDEVGPLVRELFPMDGAIDLHGLHLPLLVIQVTRFTDGMVVAFTANHTVVDGTSEWQFMNSWAQLCRKPSEVLACLPTHSRDFDLPNRPPVCIASSIPPNLFCESPFTPPILREKILHLSRETILHLKEVANRRRSLECEKEISSFQALCVHLWQAVTRARGLTEDEETTLMMPMDCRGRVSPPLLQSYFGNVVQPFSITITAAELLNKEESLAIVGSMLNRVIGERKDGQIKEELEAYHRRPLVFQPEKGSNSNKKVLIGSSPKFPMYEVDFGWGKPQAVRSGWSTKFDGKMSAYPGREGKGYIDIEICLTPANMFALENDPLFLG